MGVTSAAVNINRLTPCGFANWQSAAFSLVDKVARHEPAGRRACSKEVRQILESAIQTHASLRAQSLFKGSEANLKRGGQNFLRASGSGRDASWPVAKEHLNFRTNGLNNRGENRKIFP
jgi:hypothetical protein